MVTLEMVGSKVHARRIAMGLSKTRLAKLAELSRQTLHDLEEGTLNDLSFNRLSYVLCVLGLSFDSPSSHDNKRKKWLWMAAKSTSVSYKTEMTPDILLKVLIFGEVPQGFAANVLHFLDETPIQLVVMAVEEAAHDTFVKPQKIWKNIATLTKTLGAHRAGLWV